MRRSGPTARLDIGYAVAAVGYIAGIYLLSGSSGSLAPTSLVLLKLLHVPLFAGLAASLLLAVTRGQWGLPVSWRTYVAIAGVAALIAVGDEGMQLFTPERMASVGDVLLDVLGIVAMLGVHRLSTRPVGRPDGGTARPLAVLSMGESRPAPRRKEKVTQSTEG